MTEAIKGVSVFRLHYSSDPEKATEDWKAKASAGYPETKWQREMEMDAHAGALTAVFRGLYRPETHERPLEPVRDWPMLNGWDFGQGFPARVWAQRTPRNALRVYASLVGESVQLRPFAERTIAYELTEFGEVWERRQDYCDPAGNQPKDDGMKSVEVLQGFGWRPRWRGSRVEEGLDALTALLLGTEPDTGDPMFLIDPRRNAGLVQALKSMYRRDARGAIERIHPFVDAMDALRYLVIGTRMPGRTLGPAPRLLLDPVSGYGRAAIPQAVTAGLFER